jgi:aerobic-type carbon monoxide dehydrogenase small subunit (CoxS/CutS family)
MTAPVEVTVNGTRHLVAGDVTVAALLFNLGIASFRLDLHGAPRAPLCGMGTCFECRVVVDGAAGVRACLLAVRDGMVVETPL